MHDPDGEQHTPSLSEYETLNAVAPCRGLVRW